MYAFVFSCGSGVSSTFRRNRTDAPMATAPFIPDDDPQYFLKTPKRWQNTFTHGKQD